MSELGKPPSVRTARTKSALRQIVTNCTSAPALAAPAIANRPASAITGCGTFPVADFSKARFFFGGKGSDGHQYNYQVIAWALVDVPPRPHYVPCVIATGVVTFGTMALSVAVQATTGLWADTLTETSTLNGNVAVSPANNTAAFLEVDLRGFTHVTVETDVVTATAADVFVQLGD